MVATSQSPIVELLSELVELGAEEQALAELSELELAALGADWTAWCRPNQAVPPTVELSDPPPEGKRWPLWGRTRPGKRWRIIAFIAGRGTGKTTAIAQHVHKMASTKQWPRFVCCAQTMEKAIEIFVEAENGLIKGVPSWEAPIKTAGPGGEGLRLRYPSGAEAVITSASGVDTRGPEFHGAWCTEVAYWPRSRAMEAWNTLLDATRAGEAQVLVDSTPAAGDPILSTIKDQAEIYDDVWWLRHSPDDNRHHVVRGYAEDMRRRYAGTEKEQEEVDGLEGEERGMAKRRDIEAARRHLPTAWRRRIVILDPSITAPKPGKRPDPAGVVSMGEGIDEQLYLTDDRSGVMHPSDWAKEVTDLYIVNRCDCLVIETNRGGTLPAALITAAAKKLGWSVIDVAADAKTRYIAGTIHVKEVHAYADKWTRGDLLRQLYSQHRVSHVIGADLDSVEQTLTSWYPQRSGEMSPGDLDAVAWGCRELGGHLLQQPATGADLKALQQAAKAQRKADRSPVAGMRPVKRRGRSASLL